MRSKRRQQQPLTDRPDADAPQQRAVASHCIFPSASGALRSTKTRLKSEEKRPVFVMSTQRDFGEAASTNGRGNVHISDFKMLN